ncbi:MAG: DUF4167 domain-containing protein [Oricola sp.]
MRPQQQGRRQRNRNNGGGGGGGGNRRNQNPLSRNYESNGPDVKIRGNAQVIADKYTTLARDALSSGDNVMAENYLQHAEHYNRIIMAAQAQMQTQREERGQFDDSDSDDDDGSTDAMASDGGDRPYREQQDQREQREQREPREQRNRDRDRKTVNGDAQPSGRDASEEPQPVIGETPVEVELEEQEHAASGQPRRTTPRRPRKPRRNPDEQTAPDAGSDSSETVAAEV